MNISRTLIFVMVLFYSYCCYGSPITANTERNYKSAFDSLVTLAERNEDKSFKKAVFLVENVYLHHSLNFDSLNLGYERLSLLAHSWAMSNHIDNYTAMDSIQMALNRGIFQLIKDTIKISLDNKIVALFPFEYNFDDYDGKKDWSNTFVYTLLKTHQGNCHSLPYLYKIIADELGVKCWLALAPNHMYLKNYSKRDGWYNTELTSGDFPIDAWLTTTGYITLTAIQSGLYCDTLSNQQSIALCAIDLAKAYEKETNNYYDGFILQCCDLVLKYHAVNPQALLLKAETLKRIYQLQNKGGNSDASHTYSSMEKLYVQLYNLGYREMPDKMYKEWLQSLKNPKTEYINRNASKK